MFAKIDKNILLIILVVLAIVLIAGFFVYKYSKDVEKTVENTESEAIIETPGEQEQKQEEQLPINLEDIQVETQLQSGLTICVDKCGDSICQALDNECKDSMNCTCAETKADCPSDCE